MADEFEEKVVWRLNDSERLCINTNEQASNHPQFNST